MTNVLNNLLKVMVKVREAKIDIKRPIFANIEVNFSIYFVIRFVHLISIFTTTMPFKLIYFYPQDTFMVRVKVTETYFGRKMEILRIFVKQFTYIGYN